MQPMKVKQIFLDTNILLYAYDNDAGEKHRIAAKLILSAWDGEFLPVISIQVLQEFLVNLLKKGVSENDAFAVVADYYTWRIVENNLNLFRKGLAVMNEYGLSLWDSMIVAAARQAGTEELWTEDLNTGQLYGSVKAVNPLKE